MCLEQREGDGDLIFEKNLITAKSIRDKFNILYKWARKECNAAKRWTGCDNKDAPG